MSYQLKSTSTFNQWLGNLDASLQTKVLSRLDRVENGHFGDHKLISGGIYELRFFFGGGLRIYYTMQGRQVVLLLAGGNKSSQQRDIATAAQLIHSIED